MITYERILYQKRYNEMVTAIGLGYGFVILDTAEKYRENGTLMQLQLQLQLLLHVVLMSKNFTLRPQSKTMFTTDRRWYQFYAVKSHKWQGKTQPTRWGSLNGPFVCSTANSLSLPREGVQFSLFPFSFAFICVYFLNCEKTSFSNLVSLISLNCW